MISAVEARKQSIEKAEDKKELKFQEIDNRIMKAINSGSFCANTGSIKKNFAIEVVEHYESLGYELYDCGNASYSILW